MASLAGSSWLRDDNRRLFLRVSPSSSLLLRPSSCLRIRIATSANLTAAEAARSSTLPSSSVSCFWDVQTKRYTGRCKQKKECYCNTFHDCRSMRRRHTGRLLLVWELPHGSFSAGALREFDVESNLPWMMQFHKYASTPAPLLDITDVKDWALWNLRILSHQRHLIWKFTLPLMMLWGPY